MESNTPHSGDAREVSCADGKPGPLDDGVDVTLIRWMLSLTPEQRLQVLQQHVNAILRIRDANPDL